EVGRDLGAGFILEGTIIRSGDQLRVRPKLTNTETFEVVWYAELERDLTVEGLLEVQRQVATAVARRLSAELIGDEQPVFAAAPPTRDLEAFDNYLRGNAALVRRTPASVAQAIASYRRATSLDSLFVSALAREAYASALFVDWDWAFPGVTPEELLADAQELAARALALDSTKAEAWLATAYTRLLANRTRPGESLPAFERALELRPDDAEALHQYGQTLMSMGRYGEALAAYHGALALDPTRAMTLVPMSAISLRRGDVDQARRWIDSAVVVGPDVPYAWAIRANLRNSLGDHEGARADAEQALAIDPSYGLPARGALAVAFNGLGDSERATVELERAMLEVADPDAPGQTDALFIGGALVSLGRTDEALDFIERARPRSAWLWFYLQHSDFDSVRDQPRFIAVEREANPNAPDG
ncbi:MAG: tetratricopeptide repeat protein, partial [Gemmatimonadota bacterium]